MSALNLKADSYMLYKTEIRFLLELQELPSSYSSWPFSKGTIRMKKVPFAFCRKGAHGFV